MKQVYSSSIEGDILEMDGTSGLAETGQSETTDQSPRKWTRIWSRGEEPHSALIWSSLLLAVLQSICTAALALNGVRLLVGVGSLAFANSVLGLMDQFHVDWIRLPMIGLALVGTLLNIAILLHFQRLRNRPSAQWRRRKRSANEVRMEALQWFLSGLTLLAIAVEESIHFHGHAVL